MKNFTIGYLEGGLRDRAITRDLDWGVPVPVEGYENKCVYVWFEAVIGYLSATKEWAQRAGDDERWRDFWQKDSRAYYFMGKDNIPFHTLIWPAILMGYGDLNLPYDVPANEYITIEGEKVSTSRNWAVWMPEYLDRHDTDPLRYVLSATMPETSDSDFSWAEYLRRNNDELVANLRELGTPRAKHGRAQLRWQDAGPRKDRRSVIGDARRGASDAGRDVGVSGRMQIPQRAAVGHELGAVRQSVPGSESALAGREDR